MVRDISVAVLGAGAMGRGIAQVLLTANYKVKLYDAGQGVAEKSKQEIAKQLERLVQKALLDESQALAAIDRLLVVNALSEISDVGLVIEAIIEDVEIKRNLLVSLEDIVSEKCILLFYKSWNNPLYFKKYQRNDSSRTNCKLQF